MIYNDKIWITFSARATLLYYYLPVPKLLGHFSNSEAQTAEMGKVSVNILDENSLGLSAVFSTPWEEKRVRKHFHSNAYVSYHLLQWFP